MEFDGIALIDVFMIAAAPMKSVALLALDAGDIDSALGKQIQVILREILADDANDPHRRKITRAEGKIGRRAAENSLGANPNGASMESKATVPTTNTLIDISL